jgi:hypothetical protein
MFWYTQAVSGAENCAANVAIFTLDTNVSIHPLPSATTSVTGKLPVVPNVCVTGEPVAVVGPVPNVHVVLIGGAPVDVDVNVIDAGGLHAPPGLVNEATGGLYTCTYAVFTREA